MRMSRRSALYGIGGGVSVSSVSVASHTATSISSLSWEEIKEYGDAIAADTVNTYSNDTKSVTFSDGQTLGIGDVKLVSLDGTVGGLTFSSYTAYCFILGFRHNFSVEGTGIHFQFGKTELGGTNVAFINASSFKMNGSDSNSGGWASSYMRTTVCPAFYNVVPVALQNVVATVTKYTNNVGYGGESSNVTATSEQFFLLGIYEISTSVSTPNAAEATYQQRYAYYKNGASVIKYKYNGTSTAATWWTRSPLRTNTKSFILIYETGSTSASGASKLYGFAPAFSVGTAE